MKQYNKPFGGAESDWRDDLTEDELHLVRHAIAMTDDWHEGSIDCWQWLKLTTRLAELLDERHSDVTL